MNKKLLSIYRRCRGQSCTPVGALAAARSELRGQESPLDWQDQRGCQTARWQQAGWEMVASTKADQYCTPQEMALGQFTDQWRPGAIDHWGRTHHSDYKDANTFRWFVPTNSYQEHLAGLRRLNFGRHQAHTLARSYCLQDYRRACEMGQSWDAIILSVTVCRGGVELGRASCGGIESDCDDGYLTEMAQDLAREALAEARKNARELFAGFVQSA